MPWNPVPDLIPLQERSAHQHRQHGGSWAPPVDLYERPGEYVLIAELPGFRAGDFTISVTDKSLTLSGRRGPVDVEPLQYLRIERGQGDFSRAFSFTDPIDVSGIDADFRDGLLTVTIPKAGEQGTRRIEIG